MKYLLTFLTILCWINQSIAQTCCSGGVPLSSNLGMPLTSEKTWQFNLSYDLNTLKTLKQGSETIQDDARTRRTHSALMQMGYTLSSRISFDFLFSWVRQERVIRQFGNVDFTRTQGLGDAVLLTKYRLLTNPSNKTFVNIGMGIKAPAGPSDLRRNDGLPINADLQPGSGAWDYIGWSQVLTTQVLRPTMDLSMTGMYNIKGKNNDYLNGQVYQFGNELQWITTISDRILVHQKIVDPALSIRYRKAWQDRFNRNELPSTGGDWLFITPSLTFWVSPQAAVNTRLDLPLISNVLGNQLTTSYRLQVGFYYKTEVRPANRNMDILSI